MIRLLSLVFSFTLTACTSTSGYLLTFYADDQASPKSFDVCHGYSCRYKVEATLPKTVWLDVQNLFQNKTLNAESERQQIALAIALLEQQAGEITGITEDLPKSPHFKDPYGQQDCIDETVNTSTYLHLLQTDNLLRWHTVSTPARRGYFVDRRWPHNTATIDDIATGQSYAVDSWPSANGELPEIKIIETWYNEGQH